MWCVDCLFNLETRVIFSGSRKLWEFPERNVKVECVCRYEVPKNKVPYTHSKALLLHSYEFSANTYSQLEKINNTYEAQPNRTAADSQQSPSV